MASVQQHYAGLLARYYGRMAGDFGTKAAAEAELLESLGVGGCRPLTALDLGAGPGYQSMALAGLGFDVMAVDSSPQLLAELRGHAKGRSVTAVEADLVAFTRDHPAPVGAILCMGDTITHLESRARVRDLIGAARGALAPGGMFIVTYRDLSAELTGLDRFIPVLSEDDLIMTCFLDYEDDTVIVHDLVHVRDGDGSWRYEKSFYRKLRLAEGWLSRELEAGGFEVQSSKTPSGMTVIAARAPAQGRG